MRKFLLFIAFLISVVGLNAQSVGSSRIVYYDGYSLEFTVTKLDPAECEVVCDTEPTTPGAVSIPSSVTIEGSTFSVTYIGYRAFYNCYYLTSIEIPNSVTSIGYSAFFDCISLTSIEIPNSVTSIGNSAFSSCSGLTSIEIPNSVTSIGDRAFNNCFSLTSIEIPNSVTSIGYSAFSSCVGLESFVVEGGNPNYDSRDNCNAIIETQTNTLLYGCMNTIIPNSVTSIGEGAFIYCSKLTSIEIPNSVTSIGNSAFSNCDGLTSIEIPNSVTSIGNSAFSNCDGLTSIEIPNSVTSIGNEAFSYCDGLESFVVEGGNPNYDSRNNCNAIIETQTNTLLYGCMNTIIPNSVTSIGEGAFSSCFSLTSIEIPNSVTSIGNYAFLGCSHLRGIKCHAVDIPVTATDAFDFCPEDMTIQVPEESVALYQAAEPWSNYNVTKMYPYQNGDYVVVDYEGYSLRYTIINVEPAECEVICETKPTTEISITIPSSVEMEGVECSVTKIGNSAFFDCSGLTSIEIPNSVTSIGNEAFFDCSGLTSIEIPNSVTSIGEKAFSYCDGLESFVVEGGNPNYDSRNNCNAIIETQTNTLLYGCMNTIIPNSVTSIGNEAFSYCDGLTSIEIPNSVTSIGNEAFSYCDYLTSIEIPNSVTSIGIYAFSFCSGLTSIEIPNSVTSIGNYAFYFCDGLTSIEIPNSVTSIGNSAFSNCSGLTSIEIPNSVTSIGNYAFSNCDGLTSIEIPNSVTSIGNEAFAYCDGLTSIGIPNSVTSIGNSAFLSCSHLRSIICHAVDVPVTATNAFFFCPEDMTIQVPEESVALYQAALPWKNYNVTEIHLYQIGDYVVVDYEGYSLRYTIINVEPAECEVICETKPTTEISITIPSSVEIEGVVCNVTKIGNDAFSYCSGLTSIEIPNSVTSIGDRAFSYCSGLTSIEIPNSVTSIGNYAFDFCSGLTSIEIPNSVTSIGESAFLSCSHLRSIKCHAVDVPVTATDAFNNCPEDMSIQVPEGSVALYQAALPWNNFNIVAGFNSNINVSSNITEGGFVEGGGNYQDGTEITVSAYVNPNYGFLYWSENEEIVSYSPEYTFTVSNDRNLTANFAINHWIPDYTIYPNFMAITGVVQIDGIEQSDSNIEVGAFCGDELRGSNRLIYECEYDRYYLYLTIYGKDDDEISFRIYDNSEETELELYYNETMNFIVDDIVGNVGDPKIFNFTTDYIHKQQLTSNWNWYSTFVDVDGREGFEMMKEGLGEFGIQIKSQSAFSNYNAGNWNGGLNTVSTGNMYMIKVSEPIELSMSGVIVEPSEFPIVINTNWKWIPYPVQEEMDIASAFAGFTPNDGDIVKSQDGFTQYYQGIGWNGSLNTMMPGQGYMYQNTSGEEKILYYPTQGENRNALKANVKTENNYWKPEVTEYPTNMNVIAVVNNASDDYEIGAFCNGECRGSARPLYIEGLDKHIVFMTVYGDEEETIYLKYYDINNDEEYAVSDAFTFTVNAVLGNTMNPYVISLVPANVGEISTNGLNIYPNPANVNDAINFTREYEKVEIYNALGVKIAEYENRDYIDGIENAGIYVIKITDDGMTEYDRIIVN